MSAPPLPSETSPPPIPKVVSPRTTDPGVALADNKRLLRERTWDLLERHRPDCLMDYPPDCRGKIPHFWGCDWAAQALANTAEFRQASVIKVNPSLAQMPLRLLVLQQNKILVVPEPMLAETDLSVEVASCSADSSGAIPPTRAAFPAVDESASFCASSAEHPSAAAAATAEPTPLSFDASKFVFYVLDPAVIPPKKLRQAISKKGAAKFGRPIRGDRAELLPFIDLAVTGVTAVSRSNGVRLGKGLGFAEREWNILARAARVRTGVGGTVVATTCHSLQVYDHLEWADYMDSNHDLPCALLATETGEVVRCALER